MHLAAVILIAAAGLAYCVAAALRWRVLGRPGPVATGSGTLVIAGLVLHSAALVCILAEGHDQAFLNGVLGSWAAVASLVFLARFLTVPSAWLLVLPIGGMALLVASVGAAGPAPGANAVGSGWLLLLHVVFMATFQAATLVAGSAAALFLIAVRQVKSASAGAFQLPTLPRLEHLAERALIVATALLIGGLATGGVIMGRTPGFTLLHPTAVLAMASMALLVIALGLRVANRLGRRGVAAAAIASMALSALSAVSLMVDRHG